LLGSHSAIGGWKVEKALKLKTSSALFPHWTTTANIEPGTKLEFKCLIIKANGDKHWENGDNKKVDIPNSAAVQLESQWGSSKAKVNADAAPAAPAAAPAQAPAPQAAAQPTSAPAPSSGGGSARLNFRIKCETHSGENVHVCGSLPGLGNWDPKGALKLKTDKDNYPFWNGQMEVPLHLVKDCIRYKYVVFKDGNAGQRWEDSIADRTLKPEKKAKGVLAPDLDTFVDDGSFNKLQRGVTYVRDANERPATKMLAAAPAPPTPATTALAAPAPAAIPAGMQLVSMDQVRQWEARVVELEEECDSLRGRLQEAEVTVDSLNRDLEEERRQNEEIMQQMQFVEELLTRMKKMEEQVSTLEETKQVLVTRSESMSNLAEAMNTGPSQADSVTESIEKGLAGAKEILTSLDKKIPVAGR